MQIDSSQIYDLLKLLLVSYCVFVLNRSDRNQRELFRRLRLVELSCAKHHGTIFEDGE